MKRLSKIVTVLLLLFAFLNTGLPVIRNWQNYTKKFDPKKYEYLYNHSQYVIPQSKTPISDGVLLSYAGYRYATGLNPILINSDHPPLGKYLIGWITILTGNDSIVSLVFGTAIVITLASIIYYLTKSPLLASLGIYFLSLDTMFNDQISGPILDIIQVFFLLFYFFVFILWLEKSRFIYLVLSAIILGCFSSIKLYFPAFVVLLTGIILLFMQKKPLKQIVTYSLISPVIAFVTYMSTYAAYFLSGNSIRSFFGVQKWIFIFWKDNSVQSTKFIGDVLTLILFNQWKVWWGDKPYIQFVHWSVLWPVFFIAGIIISAYVLTNFRKLKKANNPIVLFSLWTILVTGYLSLLPISPRYLMIFYFPIYILIPLMIKLRLKKYV